MELANTFIYFIYDSGWADIIYHGVVILAFFIQMFFLLWYRKKYHLSKLQSVLTVIIVYPLAYFFMLVLSWIENGFTGWGSNNIVRLYVYIPLIVIPVSKLLKIKMLTLDDYLAPSMSLQQSISHLVCPLVGCCQGYEYENGIWNPYLDTYVFPNQWLECFVAFLIFLITMHLAKKEQFSSSGRLYPTFLILFGSTRFFLEFLRDNDKLFLGISGLALHAAFMVVVGVIWMYFLHKKEYGKITN